METDLSPSLKSGSGPINYFLEINIIISFSTVGMDLEAIFSRLGVYLVKKILGCGDVRKASSFCNAVWEIIDVYRE